MKLFGFRTRLIFSAVVLTVGSVYGAQIVIVNSGGGGSASYYNSYDSTSGYSASGNGGYTTSSTATDLGLSVNQLFGTATDPLGNYGRSAFANSNVSVNLATGEIKIFEQTGPCYATGIPACGGSVNASGSIRDGLTFHNTTGLPQALSLTWRVSLDASLEAVPTSNGTIYSSVGGTSTFALLGGEVTYDFASCGVSNCGFVDGSRTGGFDTLTMQTSGTFGAIFFATKSLAPGDSYTNVFENFNPVCQQGATCDGTHTGAVTLNLPNGVTFTSDSGLFLTQPQSSTAPEPGTWVLMVCGALALGARRVRRVVTGRTS